MSGAWSSALKNESGEYMARKEYDSELKRINEDVRAMGLEVTGAIDSTILAFSKGDTRMASQVIANDARIDRMESDIEEACIGIVIKQQPVASDWRKLASYMRMIGDLERIADNCSDICLYIKKIENLRKETGAAIPSIPDAFQEMFYTMREMVGDTIRAFLTSDIELAQAAVGKDDIVDRDFEIIMGEIEKGLKEHVDQVVPYEYLLLIDKYVERMADHASNIASWITFIVNGELKMQFTDRYRKASEEDREGSV
jgi:phosphate transport system protein